MLIRARYWAYLNIQYPPYCVHRTGRRKQASCIHKRNKSLQGQKQCLPPSNSPCYQWSTNEPCLGPGTRRFTNGYCGQIIVFPWPIIYNKLVFCVQQTRVTYRAHYQAAGDRTLGAPEVTRGSWNLSTHGGFKPQSVSGLRLGRILYTESILILWILKKMIFTVRNIANRDLQFYLLETGICFV